MRPVCVRAGSAVSDTRVAAVEDGRACFDGDGE